jgi:pimeloyl-ACP methyl ester carboxylesterase
MVQATHPRWLRKAAFAFIGLILLCGLSGVAYQNLASARDRRAYPMPGQLVDIGGYKLHIVCEGQGTPTVILDSGLGDSFVSWLKVQPEIAKFTRVCSYDRAGLGYSDSSPRPRTAKIIAKELHTLLQKARIPLPYVLVGHSMAGLDVRLYASLYRDEVAGMVLVDASHPDQEKRFPAALNDLNASWMREQEFFTFVMPFGIPRLLGFCAPEANVRAAECNFHSERESLAELKSFPESAEQAAATGLLGDLPLAVLSSDPNRPEPDLPEDLVEPTHKAWEQMQEELSHLSTCGTHTVAERSGHYIQLDRPDVVIEAVHQVLEEARLTRAGPASEPNVSTLHRRAVLK